MVGERGVGPGEHEGGRDETRQERVAVKELDEAELNFEVGGAGHETDAGKGGKGRFIRRREQGQHRRLVGRFGDDVVKGGPRAAPAIERHGAGGEIAVADGAAEQHDAIERDGDLAAGHVHAQGEVRVQNVAAGGGGQGCFQAAGHFQQLAKTALAVQFHLVVIRRVLVTEQNAEAVVIGSPQCEREGIIGPFERRRVVPEGESPLAMIHGRGGRSQDIGRLQEPAEGHLPVGRALLLALVHHRPSGKIAVKKIIRQQHRLIRKKTVQQTGDLVGLRGAVSDVQDGELINRAGAQTRGGEDHRSQIRGQRRGGDGAALVHRVVGGVFRAGMVERLVELNGDFLGQSPRPETVHVWR